MALVPILFWGSVIALVVWAVSRATRGGGESSRQRTPLELADERYARGDITREQWEQLRQDLGR
jgi:putative membrane protein